MPTPAASTRRCAGYRDLIDYWERTGSWIQQWTTLRNLARLLHTLGDHETALLLEDAADHAPDAAAVGDSTRTRPWSPGAQHPAGDRVAELRWEAPACARARALEMARRSIEHHLAGDAAGRPWRIKREM